MSNPGRIGGGAADGSGVDLDEFVGRAFRRGVRVPLVLLAVAIAVASTWIYFFVQTTRVVQEAQSATELVDAQLSSLTESLIRAATLEGVTAEPTSDATERRLEAAMAYSPSYVEFGRMDASGHLVATVPSSPISHALSDEAPRRAFYWLKGGSATVYRGSPRQAERLGGTVLLVAVPVTSPQGEFLGIVWGETSLDPLEKVIVGVSEGRDVRAYIVDSDGFMVLHPDEWRVAAGQRVSSPKDGFATGLGGRVLMGVADLAMSDQVLLVVVERDLTRVAAFSLLALMPLLVVIFMLRVSDNARRRLVASLTEDISRPVRLLEASGGRFGTGVFQTPNSTSEVVELRTLADAFGDVIRRLADTSVALEASNRDLERFAATAAHDLKEPLRKVKVFGDRLSIALPDGLDPDAKRSLDRMIDAAHRMDVLIDDILAYSRVDSGTDVFEPTALSDVVAEAVENLDPMLLGSRGAVEVGTLPTIDADPGQMGQLFQNLIGNALKFTRPDVAPIVSVTAATELIHGEPICRIVVADNGIGFDNEYAKTIFEAFSRLGGRSDFAGTGMGLAICRRIVERHDGTIEARGFPGEGSQFEVVLPIHHPSPSSKTLVSSNEQSQTPPAPAQGNGDRSPIDLVAEAPRE